MMGSQDTAAPTVKQGVRMFFFWNLKLASAAEENLKIRAAFSKRGIFG